MLTVIALVSLVITSGLLAGFFFAYWCSVMLGLRNVRDDVFVETMQNINAVLPNGRFVIPFFAPVILGVVASWLTFSDDATQAAWWCVASAVLSLVTFGITASRNVPMNNALAAVGTPESAEAAHRAREVNEAPWTMWNDVRTYTSILAFAAATIALVLLP